MSSTQPLGARPSKKRKLCEISDDDSAGSQSNNATQSEPLQDTGISGGESDALAWMKSRHAGTPVAIQFGTDEESYSFPKANLLESFAYFRSALRTHGTQAAFVEGQSGQVHLTGVAAATFARLYRYAIMSHTLALGPFWRRQVNKNETVRALLELLIAADYLGMDGFAVLEKKIAERLAVVLLVSRLRLSSDHLLRISDHNAFKSKLIWRLVVAAGVRPFLQEHMGGSGCTPMPSDTYLSAEHHPAHSVPEKWKKVLVHCRQLRDLNRNYAFDVSDEVQKTLQSGWKSKLNSQTTNSKAVEYVDPLFAFTGITSERPGYSDTFTLH